MAFAPKIAHRLLSRDPDYRKSTRQEHGGGIESLTFIEGFPTKEAEWLSQIARIISASKLEKKTQDGIEIGALILAAGFVLQIADLFTRT